MVVTILSCLFLQEVFPKLFPKVLRSQKELEEPHLARFIGLARAFSHAESPSFVHPFNKAIKMEWDGMGDLHKVKDQPPDYIPFLFSDFGSDWPFYAPGDWCSDRTSIIPSHSDGFLKDPCNKWIDFETSSTALWTSTGGSLFVKVISLWALDLSNRDTSKLLKED